MERVCVEKITVVPNGVDINQFMPGEKDETLLEKYSLKNHKIIGYVGTFFPYEGLELLIKAAPSIIRKCKDVKFLFVGGGEKEKCLRGLIQESGLSQYFTFTGFVKHSEIQKFYSVIDILAYPRLSNRITEIVTALKPLEAMALEKLVIASDVGGLKELIKNETTGLLFKAGEYTDLAEKCIFALNNPTLTERIRKQAREYVIKERNWLEICKKYLEIYKRLGVRI